MHVDGFRFDLASILTRDSGGEVLANPPAVEHIAEDPALRNTKIIAEAWDAAGLYQVGTFPNKWWSEWNGRYRDDVRRFWVGDKGMLRSFVTRLIGSPDLYDEHDQTPQKSINFITCHDGFTMRDLVSYAKKRNEANGEENRDGEIHNHSSGYGIEGPTSDTKILAVRKRQQKNLFATLLLSEGVPMLLAGDEFSRTQEGNNNAYCQDNEISWVDWSLLEQHQDLHSFVRELIAFRKAHPSLKYVRFLRDKEEEGKPADVLWLGPDGGPVDWDNGKCIGCFLRCQDCQLEEVHDDGILILFNAGAKPATFHLPETKGKPWSLALTTQETTPKRGKEAQSLKINARSVTVMVSALK
jgi:glycogen operon protein